MKIHNLGNDYVSHYNLEQAYAKSRDESNPEVGNEKTGSRSGAEEKSAEKEDEAVKEEKVGKEDSPMGVLQPDAAGGLSKEKLPDGVPADRRGKKAKAKHNG